MVVRATLLGLLATCCGLASCICVGKVPAVGRARAQVSMNARPWETANVPRGKLRMNLFENLQKMNDQRVARLSHINLAPVKCTLPLAEAIALMKTWKAEIGDDPEKFIERAKSDSHCPTASTGGDLGFVVRGNIANEFDEILFTEEPGRVYGPITTPAGLHLIYLHSCREPVSRAEATLGLPFSAKNDQS